MTTPTTPTVSVPLDQVTTALLALLNASGRKVYDGAYAGSPTAPAYPYGILYRVSGGSSDATPDMSGDPRTVTAVWQVTAVSSVRNQCEQTGRVFRDRILARTHAGYTYPLALPAGWRCTERRPDPAMPGIDRAGETPNAVFSLPARFYLTLTPA